MPPLSPAFRPAAPRAAAARPHLRWTRALALFGALALLSAPVAARAEQLVPADGGAEPPCHVHAHPGEPASRHHLMVMSAPGVAEHGGTFVSAGVGYEYRLPWLGDAVGVGGMAELMMMAGRAHPMLMASASLHPAGGLLLQASVGVTHRHEQGGEGASSSGARMSTAGVVRLTAGYDLHAGGVMLTPNVNADLGDRSTRAISAGLCVGKMF